MPEAKIQKLYVWLFTFCILFLSSASFLVHDEHSHAADVMDPGSMPGRRPSDFGQEMEKMKFAYEECAGELRQQAATIQRLEDLAETQGVKIKELDGFVSQQQREIEKMALILGRHSTPDGSLDKSHSGHLESSNSSPLRASDVATEQDTPGQDKIILKSCDDIRSFRQPSGSDSGTHWIDPDGHGGDNPFQVFCNMSSGATVISHDSEDVVRVDSCPDPGCFKRLVHYRNVTMKQMTALMRISARCQQQIQVDSCTEESFTRKRVYGSTTGISSSWWTNRNGSLRYHWPVKEKNDAGIADEGNFITNLQDLPVTELNFGQEYGVTGLCSTQFQLGKLVCYGRSQGISENLPNSRGSQKSLEMPASRSGYRAKGDSKSSKRSRYQSKPKNPQTGAVSEDTVRLTDAGCTFDLRASSPQYPPHFIDENNNIIQPILHGKTRIITLNVDEQITVGCLGNRHDKPSSNNTLKATGQQFNEAICTINSTLRVNDEAELSYSQLGCTNQNKEILKEEGTCADGRGILVRVGWNVNSNFIPLYDTCHDQITAATYYSVHNIIGRSVDADDKSNTRPSFRQAGYYPGLDVNAAFGQAQQNKTITRAVGSDALTAKYFNQKKNFFLARGHLAPDGDFIDAGSQDATYYYLNMAPQWQSFNGGNWNVLEAAVRHIATTRDLDLVVHTGTFGTMTLTDTKGNQQPLYLTVDKNNNGVIPVPKYFWKLIHDPVAETATAVVGINNPHLDRVLPSDILCRDVCSQIPWIQSLKWKITDISKGYMFCCTAEELHKAIPFAPNLTAPLFL